MYGIHRTEKRTRSSVYGLQIEANRTQDDHLKGREFHGSDIDWSKTNNNVFLIKNVKLSTLSTINMLKTCAINKCFT